jgi:hypothetical protein
MACGQLIFTSCAKIICWRLNILSLICAMLGIKPRLLLVLSKHYVPLLSLIPPNPPHFFDGSGVWTQGFVLARQACYYLNHASSSL